MSVRDPEEDALTKEELAALLNGRGYGNELTHEEEFAAQEAGLVVLFGASDDLAELRGAIRGEVDCWEGGEVLVDHLGLVPQGRDEDWTDEEMESNLRRKRLVRNSTIRALWCAEGAYSWTYETSIPHATFEIVEDGKPYCRGIVFELPPLA